MPVVLRQRNMPRPRARPRAVIECGLRGAASPAGAPPAVLYGSPYLGSHFPITGFKDPKASGLKGLYSIGTKGLDGCKSGITLGLGSN